MAHALSPRGGTAITDVWTPAACAGVPGAPCIESLDSCAAMHGRSVQQPGTAKTASRGSALLSCGAVRRGRGRATAAGCNSGLRERVQAPRSECVTKQHMYARHDPRRLAGSDWVAKVTAGVLGGAAVPVAGESLPVIRPEVESRVRECKVAARRQLLHSACVHTTTGERRHLQPAGSVCSRGRQSVTPRAVCICSGWHAGVRRSSSRAAGLSLSSRLSHPSVYFAKLVKGRSRSVEERISTRS